jgi:proteasome lid subunit RPN8/RPN11
MPIQRALRWRTSFETDEPDKTFSIFVTPRAFVRFSAHAGTDLENEVGGWLVGKWRADKDTGQRFIVIEIVLPAQHTRFGSTFLTFTQESQVWLYNQLQEYYPNKELLGWYHTHPGMGVFLSEYDTWLHRNFFPEAYQVALVIEPHSSSGGFFVRGEDGNLNTQGCRGFYELNDDPRRSVVHWHNLISAAEIIPDPGG